MNKDFTCRVVSTCVSRVLSFTNIGGGGGFGQFKSVYVKGCGKLLYSACGGKKDEEYQPGPALVLRWLY